MNANEFGWRIFLLWEMVLCRFLFLKYFSRVVYGDTWSAYLTIGVLAREGKEVTHLCPAMEEKRLYPVRWAEGTWYDWVPWLGLNSRPETFRVSKFPLSASSLKRLSQHTGYSESSLASSFSRERGSSGGESTREISWIPEVPQIPLFSRFQWEPWNQSRFLSLWDGDRWLGWTSTLIYGTTEPLTRGECIRGEWLHHEDSTWNNLEPNVLLEEIPVSEHAEMFLFQEGSDLWISLHSDLCEISPKGEITYGTSWKQLSDVLTSLGTRDSFLSLNPSLFLLKTPRPFSPYENVFYFHPWHLPLHFTQPWTEFLAVLFTWIDLIKNKKR